MFSVLYRVLGFGKFGEIKIGGNLAPFPVPMEWAAVMGVH
jgi:hypothetical protein